MIGTHSSAPTAGNPEGSVWSSLKQAIANSSGFQRWQLERQFNNAARTVNLDEQVRLYLRETLATLAY